MITVNITAPKQNTMNEYNINGYFVYITKLGRYSPPYGVWAMNWYVLNITDHTKKIIHNRPYKKISEVKLAIKNLTGENRNDNKNFNGRRKVV